MTKCDNCKYSVSDWTNPNNTDHYCRNEESDHYGYNTADLYGCEEGEDKGMTTQEIIDGLQNILSYCRYHENAPALREAIRILTEMAETEDDGK